MNDYFQLVGDALEKDELKKLYLIKQHLDGAEVEHLMEILKASSNLRSLHLKGNIIDASGAKYLAEALKFNNSLVELVLEANEIGPVGVELLADAIKVNKSLRYLQLTGSNLHLCEELSLALKANKNIKQRPIEYMDDYDGKDEEKTEIMEPVRRRYVRSRSL